ncbi:MAG: hypothetical protein EA376_07050 [Phycisphaeraceae bacterium]|nr:MAG: hypothetical protein EA376_07050 [Phycisphaeraceae bacterium]
MKSLANLVIALSLALGAIMTTTAYVPRLGLADERLLNTTLNAVSGRLAFEDAALFNEARRRPPAAHDAIAKLRADNQTIIRLFHTAPGDGDFAPPRLEPSEGVIALLDEARLLAYLEGRDERTEDFMSEALAELRSGDAPSTLYIVCLGYSSRAWETLAAGLPMDHFLGWREGLSEKSILAMEELEAANIRAMETEEAATDEAEAEPDADAEPPLVPDGRRALFLRNAVVVPIPVTRTPTGVEDLAIMALASMSQADLEGARLDDNGDVRLKNLAYVPMARTNDRLNQDLLDRLRLAGAERIRLKEFSFARWSGLWLFLVAVAGLLGGAFVVRSETNRQVAEAAAKTKAEGAGAATLSPEETLAEIRRIIESLQRDLPGAANDEARMEMIVERLDEVQRVHSVAFVDARAQLVGRLGLSGYAGLMDRFAAMERQVNRCWSAAADGVFFEAQDCLDRAHELLGETEPRLKQA